MLLERTRVKRRVAFAGFAAVLGLGSTGVMAGLLGAGPAGASTSCINTVTLGIVPTTYEGTTPAVLAPTQTHARVGDQLVYTISVSQTTPGDCALQDGTVMLTFPSGTTTSVGSITTPFVPATSAHDRVTFTSTGYVVANADIGRHTDTLPTSTPAVGNVQAFAYTAGATTKKLTGALQHASGSADYTTPVIHPETTLTKTATPSSGTVPLTVTYTFTETNVSTDPAGLVTLDALRTVVVTDTTGCSVPATPTTSSNTTFSTLAVGATWTYTCTESYTTAGTYSDQAHASAVAGDTRPAGTPASTGAPKTEASALLTVTVTPATPKLTTSASGTVTVPGTVHDTAHVTTGFTPAGTITFKLFSTTACSVQVGTDIVVAYTGDGTYASGTVHVSTAGTYYWTASATVTANNTDTTMESPCGAATESVTVAPATPKLTTKASATSSMAPAKIKDTVTVSGGDNPTGSVVVRVFTTAACAVQFGTDIVVSFTGDETVSTGTITAPAAGTYYFTVGTATVTSNNLSTTLTSPCGAATESVRLTAPGKTLTPGYWKTHLAYTGGHPTAPYTAEYLPKSLGTYVVDTTAKAFAVLQDLACKTTGINCLAGQLLAAELNIAAFGPATPGITAIVAQANALLTTAGYHGPAAYPTTWAATAKHLATELSAYNQKFDF